MHLYEDTSKRGKWEWFVMYDALDLEAIQSTKDKVRFLELYWMLSDEEQAALKITSTLPITSEELVFMFNQLNKNIIER